MVGEIPAFNTPKTPEDWKAYCEQTHDNPEDIAECIKLHVGDADKDA